MIIVGSPPPFPASVALAHIGEHLQQLGMLQNDVIGRRECHRLVASGHAHQSRANQHHAPRTGAPACASLRPGLRVVIKPAPWTSCCDKACALDFDTVYRHEMGTFLAAGDRDHRNSTSGADIQAESALAPHG